MTSFFSKQQDAAFLVLSVGADSVSLALVHGTTDKKKSLRVLFVEKESYSRDGRTLGKTIESMCNKCISKKLPKPEYVVCILDGSFVNLENRVIRYQAYHPFDFTEDFLQTFINAELTSIQESLDVEKERSGIERIVVSEYIGGVRLNGEVVATPFGAKAQMFDCMLHVLYGEAAIFELITDAVTRAFHGIRTVWYHQTFADALVLRDLFAHTPTFWVCDIGLDRTTIAFVEDDVFVAHMVIPGGMDELLTAHSVFVRGGVEVAFQEFRLHALGSLHETAALRVDRSLGESGGQLREVFTQIAQNYPKSFRVPVFIHQTETNESYALRFATLLSAGESTESFTPHCYTGALWKPYVSFETKYAHLAQELFPYVLIGGRHLVTTNKK